MVQVMLTGIARAWFDLQYASVGGVMTWNEFKKRFYEQYFPRDDRKDMIERFMRLKQGGRTVDQYAYEFDQLSKLAATLVPTELDKADRFVRGLRENIHNYFMYQPSITVRAAHLAARRLESKVGNGKSSSSQTPKSNN